MMGTRAADDVVGVSAANVYSTYGPFASGSRTEATKLLVAIFVSPQISGALHQLIAGGESAEGRIPATAPIESSRRSTFTTSPCGSRNQSVDQMR